MVEIEKSWYYIWLSVEVRVAGLRGSPWNPDPSEQNRTSEWGVPQFPSKDVVLLMCKIARQREPWCIVARKAGDLRLDRSVGLTKIEAEQGCLTNRSEATGFIHGRGRGALPNEKRAAGTTGSSSRHSTCDMSRRVNSFLTLTRSPSPTSMRRAS